MPHHLLLINHIAWLNPRHRRLISSGQRTAQLEADWGAAAAAAAASASAVVPPVEKEEEEAASAAAGVRSTLGQWRHMQCCPWGIHWYT